MLYLFTADYIRLIDLIHVPIITQWSIMKRIYNDKAYTFPQHTGKFFNFRIFIEFFIHEVKKTLKFWVLGPYLYNKYQ